MHLPLVWDCPPKRIRIVVLPVNFITVDRYWFLTWTTYGSWLPGDARGFVGEALNDAGSLVDHNQFGMPSAPPRPGLRWAANNNLKSVPITLNIAQAATLFEQFKETTQIRGWLLIAVGIMRTHLHTVVGVPGDPNPDNILRDLKAYGSRCLSQKWTKPSSETWWTTGGSRQKLTDEKAVEATVEYVRKQSNPLLIWTRESGCSER